MANSHFFHFCHKSCNFTSTALCPEESVTRLLYFFLTSHLRYKYGKGTSPLWNSKLQNTRVLQVMARSRVFVNTLYEPWHACGVPSCRQPYRSFITQLQLVMLLLKQSNQGSYPKVLGSQCLVLSFKKPQKPNRHLFKPTENHIKCNCNKQFLWKMR